MVHPCLFGANPVHKDANVANDVTNSDPNKTNDQAQDVSNLSEKKKADLDAAAKEDLEGQGIVEEKNMSMHADKSSGRGMLKVRFQVNEQ